MNIFPFACEILKNVLSTYCIYNEFATVIFLYVYLDDPEKRSHSCMDNDGESIASRSIAHAKPMQEALEKEIRVMESELNCLFLK